MVERTDKLLLYGVIDLAEHDSRVLRVDALIHDHLLARLGFLYQLVIQRQDDLITGILRSLMNILPLLE